MKDIALEWFSNLPNHSIRSFNELVDAFISNFKVHMTPKKTMKILMRCRQNMDEKVTNFISQYPSQYAQIDVKIPDAHLQNMFMENLHTNLYDKITMIKFPSFMHLCTTLCDYQNSISSHDSKSTSSSELNNQNTPIKTKTTSANLIEEFYSLIFTSSTPTIANPICSKSMDAIRVVMP